jgi:8-hydroxy-5-deazaflavin:NADPH oxidoreductase
VSSEAAPVAILGGTGALGFGLALRLAAAGVPIVIGSRDAGRAEEAAARARERAGEVSISGLENAEAARAAQTVMLCVPFRNQSENLTNLKTVLEPGQLLVDATVPLAAAVGGRATRVLGVPQGSAAQQAAEMAPDGVRVVSALHTISAASLTDLEHPLEQDVLLCGDSRADKSEAAQLIERIDGLRCVDTGRLETSRITESLTALLIGVNSRYKVHAGIRLTGLPDPEW